MLTPDAYSLRECTDKVVVYAEVGGDDAGEVADRAFAAAKKLSGSWSVKRLTPALFAKHWDAIQGVMAGADPNPHRTRTGAIETSRPRPPPVADALRAVYGDEADTEAT